MDRPSRLRLSLRLVMAGLLGGGLANPGLASGTVGANAAENGLPGRQMLSVEDITGSRSLSGPTVRGAHVAPDGSHIAYLKGSPQDRFHLDVWVAERDGSHAHQLTDSRALTPAERLSAAEQARRERDRSAEYHGVLSYTWAHDGRSVLFSLAGDLYLQSLDANATAPRRLLHAQSSAEAVLDPSVSPGGHYVAFVRRQNLWVLDLATGQEHQVSQEGGGLVSAGEAEFVAQEEFHQRHGYWWAPDDSAIVYKVVDEQAVAVVRRLEVYADAADLLEQRYPASGAANARVHLAIARLDGQRARVVPASAEPDQYLVDVRWRDDARGFLVETINRPQNRVRVRAIAWPNLQHNVLLEEESSAWIDIQDALRPLSNGDFLWCSARSGYPHLYRYDAQGKLLGALTSGAWTLDTVLAVDEAHDRVYFAANRDGVSTRGVYATSLQPGAPVHAIGDTSGWHNPEFADRGAPYVDTWSDAATPPRTAIFDGDGQRLAWLEENPLDASHPYWPHLGLHARWEYGSLTSPDGVSLDYALLKPRDFVAGRRYPAVVLVYGGPTQQEIRAQWDGSLFAQFLVQQGYLVFRLDNRGTPRRGDAFAKAVYRRLGQLEVQDQAAGLDWLRAQPFTDPGRIGVYGWSYGGYMSLMMQARLADRLAAGVAVAPVTDWRLYDTAYTERYLGTPQDNPAGYDAGEVFPYLSGLRHPLLLVHGMADDNVLFSNSTRLMAALQQNNLQFDLMTYPGAKHGISAPAQRLHLFTRIRDFLAAHLKSGA